MTKYTGEMRKMTDLKTLKEAKRRFIEHELKFPNPDDRVPAEIIRNFNKAIIKAEDDLK